MSIREALAATLASPTASDLWTLRAELLEAGFSGESRAWTALGEFQAFPDALATRQHVKAWKGELAAVHRRAAWYLYEELWRWARELKPDLPPGERRRLLDRLLAPVHAEETDGFSKAVFLGLLFQMLLLSYLAQQTNPA